MASASSTAAGSAERRDSSAASVGVDGAGTALVALGAPPFAATCSALARGPHHRRWRGCARTPQSAWAALVLWHGRSSSTSGGCSLAVAPRQTSRQLRLRASKTLSARPVEQRNMYEAYVGATHCIIEGVAHKPSGAQILNTCAYPKSQAISVGRCASRNTRHAICAVRCA